MGIRSQSDKIRKKSKAEEAGSRTGNTRPASVSSNQPKVQNFDDWTRAKNAKDFDEWTRIRNGKTDRQTGVSMRQGTKQTSTAESRLSQRRFDATSASSAEPKTAEDYKRAKQAAEWEQYAADSRAKRLQAIMARTPVQVETESGMEEYKPYTWLNDQLTGEMLTSSEKGAEAARQSDLYWYATQAENRAKASAALGGDEKVDTLLDQYNGKPSTPENADEIRQRLSEVEALMQVTPIQIETENGMVGNPEYTRLVDEQSALYSRLNGGRLAATSDLQAAGLSADEIEETAAYRQMLLNEQAQSKRTEFAKRHTGSVAGDIGTSLLSVPANLIGGVLGYADAARQGIGNAIAGNGRPIDWNTDAMALANTASTIRGLVSEDLEKKFRTEILGTNVASFLYQTGMSMADSGVIAGLSLIGVPAAASLLSGSAAFSSAQEAKQRGGTDAQALGYGLAAGIAEGLFETVSLEALTENLVGGLSTAAARETGGKKILKILESAGLQMLTEGSEEVATSIANRISDDVIMGDRSSYNTAVREYMASGMSENEAKKKAAEDWLTDLLGDFLGGALSGGIMGGAGTAISASVQGRNQQRMSTLQTAAEAQAQQETPQDILQRVAMESVQEQASPENTQRIMEQMTETPQQAMERLATETKPAYNGAINETEVRNNGREDLYLRGSGERNDSQNPRGQVSAVEEGAGRDQSRDVQTRPADGGAASLTYGEKISTKALGIANGSTTGTVRLVKSGETEATRAAAKLAEENGVKLVLFGGGNLHVKNKNGAYVEARGMKIGDTIYCRADHARYNAEQLTRHEIGHKWIADGEVNVDAVRGKLAERFTPEELDHLAGMYIDAYGSTELTADEVWEEAICDALGFMNIFEGFSEEGDAAVFLVESRRAARETRSQTRAEQSQRSETGQKLSRERKYWRPKLSQSEWSLLNRRMEQEISSSENWLDEATKWTYASERGDSVFAIYGIGDGTEATPLYASSGKTAGTDYQAFMEAGKRFDYGTDRGTEALNRLFETLRRKQGKSDDGVSATERRKSADGYDRASPVQGESNRRGSAGNSAQDSRGVKTSHELDSQGRKLTEAQQEFFKDSKAVDSDGRLLTLYHGTGAKFTVFDKGRIEQNFQNRGGDLGFYFSPYIEDARGYASEAALSTGGEKTIMEGYLNLKNPLVVEDEGWGSAISQADIRHGDLKRWAQEGGHDGIIVKSTDEVDDSGTPDSVYIAFSPEQFKSVDNTAPTSDPDIRFSQELDIDRLSKENARLKARVERLKGEMKKTKEKTVRKADVDKLARRIVKEYSSTVSASEISEELKAIGDSIVQGGEHMTYEALMDSLMPIADYVVKNARVLNDQLYQEYKELRDDLRTTRMTLSESYRNDLAGYESYNDFRKHYRGKLLLTNDGIPVDVKYQELSSQYPEYFSEDIMHPADQLTRIADVLDGLTPVYENPNSIAFEAAANEAANEMLDTLIGEDVRQTAPTYADRQEKRLQETRARYQRELARVRESRDEKIKKLKERYKAQESEAVKKRRASELRRKLLKHTEELSRRLLRPTDTKHIPEALRSSVASVLESINLESKRAPTRSQRFAKLKEVYKSIAGETVIDPSLLGGDGQTGLLDQIVAMGDKPISDMNSSELNVIWNAVRSVEASVQNANRMLTRGKFRATSEWAQRFKTDTDSRKNKRGSRITIDLEDPYTFFSHYGESGKAVYRMLRNAQDDARVKLDRIIEDVQDIVDPKTVKNAQRTRHEFTLASGEHLTLTTGQIMGLYNLSQRQQAQDHLLKGGIVQPEIKRSGGKPKIERGTRLVALTEKDLASFFSVLSGEEKNTARSLQSITATTLANWGNEASMKAYGYKKFTGTDYWPIHSAGEVLQSSADRSGSNVRSIANIGLAKAVIPGANNAIDVYDVFDDFAQHTADMIDYATWLLPMEDANRLFNYRYKDESGRTTGTIKGILDENGGKGAQQYWSKLMENIQNGVRVETDAMSTVMNKMYGNVKAAAVGANIRVIAQQPTAFVRAAAVLDPLNMARGLVKGVTKGDGWEKAKRYAPIARIKDAGSFDQSNFKSISSELYESGTVLSKLSDKAGSPAAAADAVTWGRLWNACEWQVFRENRSIAPGSEAFYGKTAELFTDMVDQTQVVDGILQRSQVMRSGNSITKQATSFMGEPIKSLNVLLRSWDKLRYETNSAKKKAAAKTFARAAAALTATDLVNAAVQSLIDAIRDDDEDKKYWERWLTAFSGISGDEETVSEIIKNVLMKGNAADNMNPLGRIPFAADIWSLIQGYSVDRMDMSAVSDFIDAASTFAKNIGGDGRYTQAYAAKQLLAAASKVFGVSAFNVTRDAWGIARTAAVEAGDVWAQYQMEKAIYNISSESNKNRYMDILYRALESGDTELYLKIAAELIDDEPNGINGKSIESAMRSRFEKHKAENSSYKLPAGMEEIIRIVPTYQEDEPETYDVSNLSAAAYQSYMEQRAANYEHAVGDVLKLSYFKSLDEAAQAKVYGYIDKLTHSYALAAASDGDYTITTNWIADAAGAEEKGISTAKYALFHLAYVSLTSDKDKEGKTIKGRAKSDKVEDWINKQGFTEPQKKYLWETVYSEKTNPF